MKHSEGPREGFHHKDPKAQRRTCPNRSSPWIGLCVSVPLWFNGLGDRSRWRALLSLRVILSLPAVSLSSNRPILWGQTLHFALDAAGEFDRRALLRMASSSARPSPYLGEAGRRDVAFAALLQEEKNIPPSTVGLMSSPVPLPKERSSAACGFRLTGILYRVSYTYAERDLTGENDLHIPRISRGAGVDGQDGPRSRNRSFGDHAGSDVGILCAAS